MAAETQPKKTRKPRTNYQKQVETLILSAKTFIEISASFPESDHLKGECAAYHRVLKFLGAE